MPIKNEVSPSRQLGLSHQDIIFLFVFRQLLESANYPAAINRSMRLTLSHFSFSSSYVYKTIDHMENQGWITHIVESNKKLFSLTSKGREVRDIYIKTHLIKLKTTKKIADALLYDLSYSGEPVAINTNEISRDIQRYFNRLINVRKLFRYIFMKRLSETNGMYIAEFIAYIEAKYGWGISEGYTYNLAHTLTEEGLVRDYWDDTNKRSKKIYELTNTGFQHFHKEGEEAIYHVKKIQIYIKGILDLLDGE